MPRSNQIPSLFILVRNPGFSLSLGFHILFIHVPFHLVVPHQVGLNAFSSITHRHHTTHHCHSLYMHSPQRQLYTMMTKDRFSGSPTTTATVTPPLQSQSITISTNHASPAVSNPIQASTLATAVSVAPNSSNCSSSISSNKAATNNGRNLNSGTTSTIYRQQSAKPPPATLPLLQPTSATIPSPTSALSSGGTGPALTNPIKSPAATGASDGKR